MLALAPLTFAVFGGVSLVGLGVNLLAIPVISFVFVPIVLAGAFAAWLLPAFDGILFGLAAKLYEWLWPGMVWAADLDLAQWRMDPPAWWYALALPAAMLLLRRWPLALRLSAAAMVLPLIAVPSRLPQLNELRVEVLDAGRGAAILLATNSHLLLFDTGDGWNTRGARITQVVIPALDSLGKKRVDLLVLPALNPDRAMGAAALAVERDVGSILTGGRWSGSSLPVASCTATRLHWDGVDFDIFSAGRLHEFCVLHATAGTHSLLLAGDLDSDAERQLLARMPSRMLASDVALISRQAGAAGSSPEWIDSIRAGLAVATGGIADSNARTLTLARWRAAGARILDTRSDGAVEIGFGTNGVTVRAPARAARYPFAWRRDE
jgi:competence protein ComEC